MQFYNSNANFQQIKVSLLLLFVLFFGKLSSQNITLDPITEGSTIIATRGWQSTNFSGCAIPSGTWLDGSLSYLQYPSTNFTMDLVVNGVHYPIPTGYVYMGAGNGFIFMPTPASAIIPANASVYLVYSCGGQTLTTNTVVATNSNFNMSFSNSPCQPTVDLTPNYQDDIGLFSYFGQLSSAPFNGFSITYNNVPVTAGSGATDFTVNNYSVSSGVFGYIANGVNSDGAYNSQVLASVYGDLKLTVLNTNDQYIGLRYGPVSIIFANSSYEVSGGASGYRFSDASNSITERPISYSTVNTYNNSPQVGDVLEIESTPTQYILKVNSSIVYTASKTFSYSVSAGSISPTSNGVGQTSTWTLPTTPGVYTVVSTMSNYKYIDSYTVYPIPQITNTTLSSSVCTGTTLNLNLSSTSPANFSWIAIDNPDVNGESTVQQNTGLINDVLTNTTLVPHTVTYSVTPTGSGGVNGSCVGPTETVTVTVNPNPVVAISGVSTICNGDSTVLTANGANSYLWSNGTPASSITVKPSASTTFNVTGIDVNGCSNSAGVTVNVNANPVIAISGNATICNGDSTVLNVSGANTYLWNTGSSSASITVHPTSTLSYSVTGTDLNGCKSTTASTVNVNTNPVVSISGSAAVCSGDSTTLMANGAITYMWDNNSTSSSVVVHPSSATTYSVIGTDANGCKNSATYAVSIYPSPVVQVSGSTDVCLGSSATLTASGASNYLWNTGLSTQSIQVSPSVNTQYFVIGTDANNCKSLPALFNVNVNPLPQITSTNNASICSGSSVTVQLAANIPSSFSWVANNNTNVTGESTTTQIGNSIQNNLVNNSITAQTVSYVVIPTSLNGACVGNAQTVSVVVNPLPIATIMVDKDTLCEQSACVNLSANFGTFNIQSASWSFGDGNSSSGNSAAHCYSSPGNYAVSLMLTDVNACTNSVVMPSAIVIVPRATADFTFSSTQAIISANDQINFTNLSSNASSYLWTFEANATSNQTNPTYTYSNAGLYSVELIAMSNYGCNDTIVKQIEVKSKLFVPNGFTPNGDLQNENFVILGLESYPDNKLQVFNRWGNLVYEKEKYDNTWNGYMNTNAMAFGSDKVPQGTYYFVLDLKEENAKPITGFVVVQY